MTARLQRLLDVHAQALADGHPEQAAAAERMLAQQVDSLPAGALERALVHTAQAERLLDEGRPAAAAIAFDAAVAVDDAAGRRDGPAIVRRLRAAVAHGQAGDARAAKAHARAALAAAEAGAAGLVEQARAVIDRLDGREPDPAPPPTQPNAPAPPGPRAGKAPVSAPVDPISTRPRARHAPTTDPTADLGKLVGLAQVKADVAELAALMRLRAARTDAGMPNPDRTLHLAMLGAPGTGKTTVARLIGRIYAQVGALPGDAFVEATRADLVAGYIGQTAAKVDALCDQALGGVLFVDEAYALAQSDSKSDFGLEALAQLVKRMEDDRDQLAVILAGYDAPMETMLDANPGLRSRLQTVLRFADYSPAELMLIFDKLVGDSRYRITTDGRAAVEQTLGAMYAARDETWANARTVRQLFERMLGRHAVRAGSDGTITTEELDLLTAADAAAAAPPPAST